MLYMYILSIKHAVQYMYNKFLLYSSLYIFYMTH